MVLAASTLFITTRLRCALTIQVSGHLEDSSQAMSSLVQSIWPNHPHFCRKIVCSTSSSCIAGNSSAVLYLYLFQSAADCSLKGSSIRFQHVNKTTIGRTSSCDQQKKSYKILMKKTFFCSKSLTLKITISYLHNITYFTCFRFMQYFQFIYTATQLISEKIFFLLL